MIRRRVTNLRPVLLYCIRRNSSTYTSHFTRELSPPVIKKGNSNNNDVEMVDVPSHFEGVPQIKKDNLFNKTSSTADKRMKHFPKKSFNVELSTEQNYGDYKNKTTFHGEFADIRENLDYNFHANYVRERQLFQDEIIIRTLEDPIITDAHGNTCARPEHPWLVFTAGAMGAGKSYTIDKLVEKGRFPLSAFVRVDPDEIRRQMPEFQEYIMEDTTKEIAGELTRKEAGFVCEILTAAALRHGKNVLVDGSLKDWDWYKDYFQQLRNDFPFLRIAILHVSAPKDVVLQRAAKRALVTGRVVPQKTLEMAFEQVPKSVRKLAPMADYFCELSNAGPSSDRNNNQDDDDIEIVTEGETWTKFRRKWYQLCAEWY